MIEVYTPEYRSMGYHTDQSQDLADDSYICIFSCYKTPLNPNRLLYIKNKLTDVETHLLLEHNSIVVFSTEFNAKHLHKIVLDAQDQYGNTWLGLTLRTGKTMIIYDPEPHFLGTDRPLREAETHECKDFYKMRAAENQQNGAYHYPDVDYTISPGDLMMPRPAPSSSTIKVTVEARLKLHNTLILHQEQDHPDLTFISQHFGGEVIRADCCSPSSSSGLLFLAGDIGAIKIEGTASPATTFVVEELSHNYDRQTANLVTLGELPINIHDMCVFFRRLFNQGDSDLFTRIQQEHQFQNLTESDKPGKAYRTGLYITDVKVNPDGGSDFHLLRCSSNFTGPTEGIRPTDREILQRVNAAARQYLDQPADLNHVLAQIYHNSAQSKAKIKAHSDKTKDMPINGSIAFCTFYDKDSWHPRVKPPAADSFDRHYKDTSVLTELVFKLKKPEAQEYSQLPHEFSVTLYPGSVLLIPLSTNRIYMHEIRPSGLTHEYLPTRMGYVIRSSETEAVHKDRTTLVRRKRDREELQRLQPPTHEQVAELRKLYFVENATDRRVHYGEVFFSMNQGDFMQPIPTQLES